MAIKTLYTAVGRFERRTNGCNRSCPIILLGGQEYMVDMQEMVIWSMLHLISAIPNAPGWNNN